MQDQVTRLTQRQLLRVVLLCALCLLALLWATRASAQEVKPQPKALTVSLTARWIAQAADLGTTLGALNLGAVEANPLFKRFSPPKLVFAALVGGAAIDLLLRHVGKQHPRLVTGLAWLLTGAHGAAAIHNGRVR